MSDSHQDPLAHESVDPPGPESERPGVETPRGARELYTVQRVVYRSEAYMDFGADGRAPRMAQRQVPVTEWATFEPVDYALRLQKWAKQNMPVRPMTPGRQLGALVAVIVVIVAIASAAVSGGDGAGPIGAVIVIAFVLLAVGMSALRNRNPDLADRIEITSNSINAYNFARRGHYVASAASAANAAAFHSSMHARRQRDWTTHSGDQQFWSEVSQQPVEYQWQAADWFRSALQAEYAARLRNRITPEEAPVPTYEEIAHHLYHTAQVW